MFCEGKKEENADLDISFIVFKLHFYDYYRLLGLSK